MNIKWSLIMEITKPQIMKNDPWRNRNQSNQEPPDIDAAIKDLFKRMQNDSTPSWPLLLILVAAIVLWAATGFFIVSEGETGIILRFGKFNREVPRGLSWHAPFIENKTVINTEKVENFSFGAEMLTTDENYANVKINVIWRIEDPKSYLFNVSDPYETLREATISSLRQVVGGSTLDNVLSSQEKVRYEIESTLKSMMDEYGTGIEVRSVKVLGALPPQQVSEAFADAVKAREDEQRFINMAEAYYNKIIPKAKGRASRIVNEATAFRESTILKAQAEIAEFKALLQAFKSNPDIVKNRLYLQTMESVLARVPKIILSGDQNISYLPLGDILKSKKGA